MVTDNKALELALMQHLATSRDHGLTIQVKKLKNFISFQYPQFVSELELWDQYARHACTACSGEGAPY
jgi:hypothetical protein